MDGVQVRRHVIGHGRVAEIILDRPSVLNALNTVMLVRLAQVCAELKPDGDVRAVVLSASGDRAFCVGADLKERNAMNDAQLLAQRVVFRTAFGELLGLPQPVVAAVHGFALGGGCELALSCDIIVADETAEFGLPETTVGLVPGCGGTQLSVRRLGAGRAAELVLTGRRVKAAEAERIGLADRLVPAGAAERHRAGDRGHDRGQLAGRGARGQAGAAERLGGRAARGAGHRGRGLADRGAVRGPARGHRGVQREADAELAGGVSRGEP